MALKELPKQFPSASSRSIQVADVRAYYINRYRDFEITPLTIKRNLARREAKIRGVFGLIQPRPLDFIGKGMWRAWDTRSLETFTLAPHDGSD